ncbi:hypothetical protein LOTGIDRAFT_155410 [Lottia gigantea]|uniref:Uncharacterized protein n=1 Tax=Lottia gigantea TaxID=225164 RepID=V3ZIN1_LOTGI|nr:hypothetical protein LOTGIDRAFT_155410 [Lottia gigantea]ESO84087.1 hypothetical protein LOTGIDRAFT_155410 [Lottia gigantea]
MRKAGSHLNSRIQEFELWRKDGDFFRDGEYAKRRAKRRERVSSLEGDRRLKRWKKLYIPAVLGMMTGSFLTLASTVHGLGKNTIFWSSKEIFHVLGPVFLCSGLVFLVLAAACSHQEEEKLRIKLGLPSMFPQSMKTLPSEELTSITNISELESSHSLAEKLASKSKERPISRINSETFSNDGSVTSSFKDRDSFQPKYGPSLSKHNPNMHLKRSTRSVQSGNSIAPEIVFEVENETCRSESLTFKETDIDAYCAMINNEKQADIKSNPENSELLSNIDVPDQLLSNHIPSIQSNIPLIESKSQKLKSKELDSTEPEIEHNISETKKEKSRIYCFHRLVKAKDRFISSASETSSGYSSGTNMVDTEQFECFTSFDSEQDGDIIESCS